MKENWKDRKIIKVGKDIKDIRSQRAPATTITHQTMFTDSCGKGQ